MSLFSTVYKHVVSSVVYTKLHNCFKKYYNIIIQKIDSKRDREVIINEDFMYIFDKFSGNKQKKNIADVAKKIIVWHEFTQVLKILNWYSSSDICTITK